MLRAALWVVIRAMEAFFSQSFNSNSKKMNHHYQKTDQTDFLDLLMEGRHTNPP